MITEEYDDSKAKTFSFYCRDCFADNKFECTCSRITRIYPGRNQDFPVDDMTEEEWDLFFPEHDD